MMKSNDQIHRGIVDTLRRASAPITLPDIAERMGQAVGMVRPTLAAAVASGEVLVSTTKPAHYRLHIEAARAGRRDITNSHAHGTYNGAELQRNPGISAERYAAFLLPSRVGDRLHFPDGRVTPVNTP